ncbi:MAG: C-GCAxxG-C-C family protein [Spirochaetia bacterium]|nr:C-GCAxxG-C-C family protein [Spirochaetia bacterium]
MKHDRHMVIWGAGKIGRGFLGDLACKSGYTMTFVDADEHFVHKLSSQGYYTLYHMRSADEQERMVVDGYAVLHTADEQAINEALSSSSLLALSIFPKDFPATAKILAQHIESRRQQPGVPPLDILICTNMHHPGPVFGKLLEDALSEQGKAYYTGHVGIVETLVIRMAVQPTAQMLAEDPLVVMTNGYEQLTADGTAFRNPLPEIEGFRYTERIAAEEMRKMYTYNMIHAVYAYAGAVKGYDLIIDAARDKDVACIAEGALEEISQALEKRFGFSTQEMSEWNAEVLKNMANPILQDTVERVGGDPKRKLSRTDRLIGPALECRMQGVMPYYLSAAIACGYLFTRESDAAAVEIQDYLKTYEIKDALRRYSNLHGELELMQLIREHYDRIRTSGMTGILEDRNRVAIRKRAYQLGFTNELTIRGCAQCTVKALGELTGGVDSTLFKATSGFSGGMAITGDGSCGGYAGGILCMSSRIGRRLEHLSDGDKVAQYTSFDMAQELHDKYIETYGSVTCSDIHRGIFGGTDYCLRTKAVRADFEEAGAHLDKCTTVIATASSWSAEILMKYDLIDMSDLS